MSDAFAQALTADRARLAPRISAAAAMGRPSRAKKATPNEGEDRFLPIGKLRTQYIDYLMNKVDEIEEQKSSRRYYHGIQYTGEQLAVLRRRHQPPLTWNRINRKINGIIGLVERMRSDPKALPRALKDEQGANIATEVIRSILDANDWKGIEPWCLLQACIDGVAGVQLVLTRGDEQDPTIGLTWVIADEFFYDARSYRMDFADSRYHGLSKWIDLDDAIEMFPGKEDELRGLIQSGSDLTTNPDREYKWVNTATQSIRLIEHWYRHRGEWYWVFYAANTILDEGLSPFFDAEGKRTSSFIMFSATVDQDGDRYGFVRSLKDPQDSLNQSKSKSLHLANSRRLIGEKGAVDDVERTRLEWARPDGYVEVNPGMQIKPDDTSQDLQAFVKFSDDAKNEIEQFANLNVALLNGTAITNLSGRAIEMLRQPGMAELGPFVMAIRQWKLAVNRAVWNAAQRHWTAARWLRLANNENLGKFIQLNGLGLDQFGRPALVNALGSLDVDIILEEGPDIASVMQETFDNLRAYPPGTFPPQVLIEMSSLPRTEKNRILQMLTPHPAPPSPAAQIAARLQIEGAAARNAKTAADARKSDAGAVQLLAKSGQIGSQAQQDAAEFERGLFQQAAGIVQPQQPQQPQQQQQIPPQPAMAG